MDKLRKLQPLIRQAGAGVRLTPGIGRLALCAAALVALGVAFSVTSVPAAARSGEPVGTGSWETPVDPAQYLWDPSEDSFWCLGRSSPPSLAARAMTSWTAPTGSDVIHGRGGNDSIDGKGGDDLLCGGSGDDLLYRRRRTTTSFEAGPETTIINGGDGLRFRPGRPRKRR